MKLVALKEIPNSVAMISPGQEFVELDPEQAGQWVKLGFAESIGTAAAASVSCRGFSGLIWDACEVVIIASGPSLTEEQVAAAKRWRDADRETRRAIVINTSYRLAPWADLLYACDSRWWEVHYAEVKTSFAGELWSYEKFKDVRRIDSARLPGLGRKPGVIHQGSASGYQAINLAWQAGARRMILIGFDGRPHGKKEHWHGDHPNPLKARNPYGLWVQSFATLAADLDEDGTDVINATPGSALTGFPKLSWQEAFAGVLRKTA